MFSDLGSKLIANSRVFCILEAHHNNIMTSRQEMNISLLVSGTPQVSHIKINLILPMLNRFLVEFAFLDGHWSLTK